MAESAQFDAMLASVAAPRKFEGTEILAFLERQPGLEGRDLRLELEDSDVRAGVSAGHLFFQLDDANDPAAAHCGHYVLRFEVGDDRLFRQTSLRDQFDVMRTLRARGLTVPDAVWFAPAGAIAAGTPALIMRRIDAPAPHMLYMQNGPYGEASPAKRAGMLRNYMTFAAQLHSQPVAGVDLAFLARRGGEGRHFIDREIDWMQAELHSRFPSTEDGERAALLGRMRRTCDEAADILRAKAPRHRSPGLVHGDLTLGNAIFHEDGSLAAVLDWELCHEGLPEEDVAWLSLAARSSANFYKAPGDAIPSVEDVAEIYASVGGTVEDLAFAAALAAFHITSIFALALRGLPPDLWPSQGELWDQQEAMLLERLEGVRRR